MRAGDIQKKIRELLDERGPGKTICPSEVARALEPDDWRPLMDPVRKAAATLAKRGEVGITQKGRSVDALTAHGPIRIAANAPKPESTYCVGRGEEGVFHVEPYKSELLPLWRFKTPAEARKSAAAIWKKFVAYRKAGDGPGMDMARKYLQMGFTRARRYANHPGGRKYDASGAEKPRTNDPEKAKSAAIFYAIWQKAERDRVYRAWRSGATSRRSPRPD